MQVFLENIDDTEAFGRALGDALPSKCLVFLNGQLGAGKTSLVRGLLRGVGFAGAVKSPTYSLVEEYADLERPVYHFDLYRLKDPEELEWMGMQDYLNAQARCLIEWPEMGRGFLPPADIEIVMEVLDHGRMLKMELLSPKIKNTVEVLWKNNKLLL